MSITSRTFTLRLWVVFYFIALIILFLLSCSSQIFLQLSFFDIPRWLIASSRTILLYSICLFPFFLSWYDKPRRNKAYAYSLALTFIISFVPFILSNSIFYTNAYTQAKNDFDELKPFKIETILLISNASSPKDSDGTPVAVCDATCLNLLYNKEVKSVVVRRIFAEGSKDGQLQQAYWLEKKDICDPIPGGLPDDAGQQVKTRIAAGECLMSGDISPQTRIDATIRDNHFQRRVFCVSDYHDHVITVYKGSPDSAPAAFQHTSIQGKSPTAPLFIGVNQQAIDSPFYIAHRDMDYNAPISVAQALHDKLSLNARSAPAGEDQYAVARRLFALPKTSHPSFTGLQLTFLEGISRSIRTDMALTLDQYDFIRRLLHDERVSSTSILMPLFLERSGQLAPLLPDMLDMFESTKATKNHRLLNALSFTVKNSPHGLLMKNKDRIFDILEKTFGEERTLAADDAIGLIAALGDLGPESLPLLTRFLGQDSPTVVSAAAASLCRMGSPDADPAIPALQTALKMRSGPRADDNEANDIATALISLGHKTDVAIFAEANAAYRPLRMDLLVQRKTDFSRRDCPRLNAF